MPAPDYTATRAVFLSYASQDAEAARRICDALRTAGVEVWFDQSELRGGDSWDQKIRRQIKECALFMPVVSANTQARREGYFRLEWKLADDRTHLMAKGTPFLVPVCIDDTKDWDALVPDSFMSVQWTRLPGGETTESFCSRVVHLLEGGSIPPMVTRPPMAVAPRAMEAATAAVAAPAPKKIPLWPLALGALVVVGAGVFFALRPKPAAPPAAVAAAPPTPPAAPVAAEFPRDPELKRAHKLLYQFDAMAEDFALAEDIVKPLLAARPNDPEVATVAAEISQEYLTRGFDLTQARRALAQRLTERAVALAPDSPEAMAALGRYLLFINAQLGRAEELLRRAIELKPNEPRFHRTLFYILTFGKPTTAEGDAFGAQMAARFPSDPLVAYDIARRYKDKEELVPMEQWFDKALALAPLGSALVWKSWCALEIHGDLAGMKSWLDRVPDRLRTSSRVVNAFYVHAMFSGDTATALQQLNALGDSWMTDFDFTGPKALLIGDLLRLNGSEDLARLQFEAALAEVQRVLARDPTDWRPRRAEMLAFLALGRRDEARTDLRLVVQALGRPYRWSFNNSWTNGALRTAFLVDERDLALTLLKESAVEPQTRAILRNLFRLDPKMAPWRDDAEVNALLAEPKETKTPATAAPLSEAAQLAARAKSLYTKFSYTREDLATAEDLARRATEKEPDSAAAWGALAAVHATYLQRSWDTKEKRRQDTQTAAMRALGLDPDEVEALWALGRLFIVQGAIAQAEKNFRRAVELAPTNNRMVRALAGTLDTGEQRAMLQAAIERDPRDPLVHYDLALTYSTYGTGGANPENLAATLEHLDAGIAVQPMGTLLLLKAALLAGWRGDLAGMRTTLDQLEKLPLFERTEDRAIFVAMWGGFLEHNSNRVLAAAALTAKNYFADNVLLRQPKDWTLALTHQAMGKDNLARVDWQHAESVLRARLRDDPDNQGLACELAITLAWLDRRDEATTLLAPVEATWKEALSAPRARYLAQYYAAAGDSARTASYFGRALDSSVFFTRKTIPLDPWWDKVRAAPEFVEALKEKPAVKK